MDSKDKKIYYDYKLARLIHYDYSSIKDWYIDSKAYDVKIGKLKRKRISEFNKIKDIEKRRKYNMSII